jgi:hypothetical protein
VKDLQREPRKKKQPPLTPQEHAALRCEALALLREQSADRRNTRIRKWAPDVRRYDYAVYMRSPEWKDFRLRIIAERGSKCEKCGRTSGVIQVHHLHYRNLGCEKPQDVLVVCDACHRSIHHDH